MAKEKICGIYCIENLINGKKYIGQSVNINDREYHHFNSLRNGTHYNECLQKEYDFYNEENFIFYIVVECSEDLLDYYEILYIKKFNVLDKNFGYNINPGGSNPHYFSEIELQKRSDSIKQKWEEMDDKKRNHILTSLQDGYNKWKQNITDEEKSALYKRRAETIKAKSSNEIELINTKRVISYKETIKNRTPEREEEIKRIYSESSKLRWNNTPPEVKEALRQSIIKPVYCPQLDMKFESVKDASVFTSVPSSNIVKVCKDERKYAGKLPNGVKLTWVYI